MTPLIDGTPDCLGLRTRMASRAVTRAFNARMRALDLQITQFAVLASLARGGGGSVAALADRLDVEPSAMVRNVGALKDRGLVTDDGGRGRRGRRLFLTPAGRDLLDHAVPIWADTNRVLERALDGDADGTRTVLARLEDAARSLERPDTSDTSTAKEIDG